MIQMEGGKAHGGRVKNINLRKDDSKNIFSESS